MKYQTRDFGEMEFGDQEILDFVQPPFGFEEYKKYVLIYDQELGTSIVWMQSIEDPNVCFVLFDPMPVASFYKPKIPDAMLKNLGDGKLVCWVIGIVPNDFQKTTVNLKSPIIVNVDANLGAQVVLEQDYPIRFAWMQEAE